MHRWSANSGYSIFKVLVFSDQKFETGSERYRANNESLLLKQHCLENECATECFQEPRLEGAAFWNREGNDRQVDNGC
jgi:hypothetical protein